MMEKVGDTIERLGVENAHQARGKAEEGVVNQLDGLSKGKLALRAKDGRKAIEQAIRAKTDDGSNERGNSDAPILYTKAEPLAHQRSKTSRDLRRGAFASARAA